MAVDLGLDRIGAGERGLFRHQGGGRAEREAGDVPHRLQRGRANAPLGHQLVETLEVPLLPAPPCARSAWSRAQLLRSTASWPA